MGITIYLITSHTTKEQLNEMLEAMEILDETIRQQVAEVTHKLLGGI